MPKFKYDEHENAKAPLLAKTLTSSITQKKPATAVTAQKTIKKPEIILNLLTRSKGATIAQLQEATSWQPHSIRAVISGIRKKGIRIIRSQAKDGATLYHAQKS